MLVIGLGNPDRGDDAAGILVARGLAAYGVKAVESPGGTLDLLEIWANNDKVVAVDAVYSNAAPGTIYVWDTLAARLPYHAFRSSTHAFGLADAIELARALDRLPKSVTIYGIEAAQFFPGTPPSSPVLLAVNSVIEQIASRAKNFSS